MVWVSLLTQGPHMTTLTLDCQPDTQFGGIVAASKSCRINPSGETVSIIGFPLTGSWRKGDECFALAIAAYRDRFPNLTLIEEKEEGGRVFVQVQVLVHTLRELWNYRDRLAFAMGNAFGIGFTTQ